jgi:hypothetical protein
MKRVNTAKHLVFADEDRRAVRSDMGNKMTEQLQTTTTKKQTKKEQLLANPDVKRWFDNMSRGSPLTAEMRLRRLSYFCKVRGLGPMELVEIGKDLRIVTDIIQDHITWMESQNKSPGYIESTVTAIKSWLSHFDIEIKRRIKINDADLTPTLEHERVPDQKEISEIFNRASLRTATEISLIAKAGLRPQVLGNHDGTDGLVIKDMPDIVIEDRKAVCVSMPPRILVRKSLSKARHQYVTFLTENGTRKLVAYLNDRLAKGEKIGPDSAVIAPDTSYNIYRGNNNGKKFLPTRRISKNIRDVFRPRFKWRPYVLRAFFDTQLLMAESRGKIAHDFRVFFMGHKGSMEARYTTNKGILPDALVKEMKKAFKRSEEFLDLEMKTDEQMEMQQKTGTENPGLGTSESESIELQATQIIVKLDQVEGMILQGWRLVATIPENKAVVEKNGFGKRSV